MGKGKKRDGEGAGRKHEPSAEQAGEQVRTAGASAAGGLASAAGEGPAGEALYDGCGLDLPPASAYDWAGPACAPLPDAEAVALAGLADALFVRLSGHRLAHSMSVARTAGRLAASHGVDPYLAQAAGLLHDWDKHLSADEQWEKAERYGVMPCSVRDDRLTPVLHGRTAAASLPERFPGLPSEVFQAIFRHTVGAPRMEPLDIVVYCADFLEPLRGEGVAPLRPFAAGPLVELFAACVRQSLLYVLASGRYLGVEGVEVWNAYESHLPAALAGRRCRILFD